MKKLLAIAIVFVFVASIGFAFQAEEEVWYDNVIPVQSSKMFTVFQYNVSVAAETLPSPYPPVDGHWQFSMCNDGVTFHGMFVWIRD